MVSDPVQQPGQGLKAVVIGLGVLLAICAAIVIGTIVYRLFHYEAEPAAASPAAVSDAPDGFVASLPVPAGCAIESVTAEGNRLIVQVGGNEACRRVLIADMKTGKLIGRFQFQPE